MNMINEDSTMINENSQVVPSVWERDILLPMTADDFNYQNNYRNKRPKFSAYYPNMCLDLPTKRAALVSATSVVSLESFLGNERIFEGSGTVIETDDSSSIILTSADIIRSSMVDNSSVSTIKIIVHVFINESIDGEVKAFDYNYNIAIVKIKSNVLLTPARIKHVDDSLSLDMIQVQSFQFRPHSDSYTLIPGDKVIAVGRYFVKPYELMAAPGEFCVDRCERECKELFRADCIISRSGVGGPILNRYGEVIGICFYGLSYTPFLPINLASKWWEQYKKNDGDIHRPCLEMELSNLYSTSLDIMESIIRKFPNTFNGVIVEKVAPGSSAHSAGISPYDVIVQFGGKTIQSFLELIEQMWDNVGKYVDLIVLRPSDGVRLHLSMLVDEITADKFYRWPLLVYY